MGFLDVIGSIFEPVTKVATAVAPYVLPAAAIIGGVGLLAGNKKMTALGGGLAAGSLLGQGLTGGFGSGGGGGSGYGGDYGVGPGAGGVVQTQAPGTGGILGKAGIAGRGAIGQVPQQQARGGGLGGILSGITGADLLKFGGNIIAGLDTTEEDFAKARLALERERMERDFANRDREFASRQITPVKWDPMASHIYSAAIARMNPEDPSRRKVL